MVYEFLVVFQQQHGAGELALAANEGLPGAGLVIYLCFGAKILLGTKYNGRSILCAGMLYFCGAVGLFQRPEHLVLGLCVALLAAKDVPLRR